MPDDTRHLTTPGQRDIATLPLNEAIDIYAPNFAAVLPANVSLDHFKRMVVTAINTNPELAQADRRSLFNACIKCASDGLLPDGREAALVVFNTKIKTRVGSAYEEHWQKLAQYMPMVAGIRKRMRNSGEVVSAVAEVVCENDEFDYALGDDPFIRHKPAPFSRPRGRPVGAYAIIRLKSGEVLRDVMPRDEIEAARSKSRAKDSLMWTDFWGEGARKTVLRRCSKAAPQSAVMESLMGRDEELAEGLPTLAELPPPAGDSEPPRGIAYDPQTGEFDEPDPPADPEGTLQEEPAGIPPATAEPAGDAIPADGNLSPRHSKRPVAQGKMPSAGDMNDMLGGKPHAPQAHRWSLPQRPVARDWELFEDWLEGKLDAGISGRALRADNEHALKMLRDADPARYEAIQERLAH